MAEPIPTGALYAGYATERRAEPSELSKTLEAVRHAPFSEQAEFWAAIRDSLTAESDPTEPDSQRLARRLRKAHPTTSVVYYVRFGDRVKIGYSTNLDGRLKAIPHDEVLATEPGTIQDERARHAAFADLRVTGEWFRYEEPLVSHIAGLQ